MAVETDDEVTPEMICPIISHHRSGAMAMIT
jgi:hypothetical protein